MAARKLLEISTLMHLLIDRLVVILQSFIQAFLEEVFRLLEVVFGFLKCFELQW